MSTSNFERRLLRASTGDGPTRAQREKNFAAVMNAAGFAAATTTTLAAKAGVVTKAGAGGATKAASGVVSALAAGKTALATKIAVVLAAAVVTGGAAFAVVHSTGDAPRVSDSSEVPVPAVLPSLPPRLPVAVVPVMTVRVEPPVATPPRPPSSRPVSIAKTRLAPKPREDGLAEEARLLQAAQMCLTSRDVECAAERLREHQSRFARSPLSDEAMLLRIELAQTRGDAREARALAAKLLEANPNGPYAKRVSLLTGQ